MKKSLLLGAALWAAFGVSAHADYTFYDASKVLKTTKSGAAASPTGAIINWFQMIDGNTAALGVSGNPLYFKYDPAATLPAFAAPPTMLLGASAQNGATPYHLIAAASTNATLVSAGNHTLLSVQLGSIGAVPGYLKIYDKATQPVCGTDVPVKTFVMAGSSTQNGGASNVAINIGAAVILGLGFCVTQGIDDTDSTAVPASTYIVNIDYK